MQNYNNKNSSSESKEDVMDYLIQKLNARQKKVSKLKNLLKFINNLELFLSQRKELYTLLNNLEEDLKQAVFAIKALLIQNKTILNDYNNKIVESQNIYDKLSYLLRENENLRNQLMQANRNINNFNNDFEYYHVKNMNNEPIKEDDEDKEEDELKSGIQKLQDYSLEKSKKKNNNNKKDISNLKYEQLSNIKNIIDSIKKNKIELKQVVEQHFQEQNKRSLDSDFSYKRNDNMNISP